MRRNTIANYAGQGWTLVMNVAFLPVYIRFLGFEAYGLVGVFVMVQAWLLLLDAGMTAALGREMARFTSLTYSPQSIRDLLRSVELLGGAVCIAFTLLTWSAADWLAAHWLTATQLPAAVVARSLGLIAALCALRFLENIYRSSIIGLQHQVTLNAILAATATVRAVGAIAVLAWLSPSVTAFFLWQMVVSAATVALLAWQVYRLLPAASRSGKFSFDALRQTYGFALGSFLVTALGFVVSQADKVVLSAVLSLREFGVYTLAYALAGVIRAAAQPIDQAVYPRLIQLHQRGDQDTLSRLYHKAAQYNVVLIGSAGVFLAVFGRPVLELWTGDPATAAELAGILGLLSIGMVLNGIMNGPYYLQMAAGWTGLLVRINAVMVIVFVPLTYLLTSRYGMFGAASSWTLINAAYLLIAARLMHRRLLPGELAKWYVYDLTAPLVAGLSVAVAAGLLLPWSASRAQNLAWLALAFASTAGAAALAAHHVRTDMQLSLKLALRRA